MTLLFDQEMLEVKNYWLNQLSNKIQKASLPSSVKLANITDNQMEKLSLSFSQEELNKMRNLCGDSLFLKYVIVMTALKICLYKYNNCDFITVGSPARKRDDVKEEINALAIVNRVTSQMTCKELMMEIRQTLLDGYDNQSYPMDLLVRDMKLEHSDICHPLFSLLIELTNIHCKIPKLPQDLIIRLTYEKNNLYGEIEYNALMFSQETISIFRNHLNSVLQAVLSYPDYTIDQLLNSELKYVLEIGRTPEVCRKRIDLEKIETTLKLHPIISDAKVMLKNNESEEKVICAYLMSKPNSIRSNQLIKSFLLKHLPEYMIPSELIWDESKDDGIDLELISKVEKETSSSSLEKVLPRNRIEQKIADIWKVVLNCEDMGVHENFFEIGGDSILSVQAYYNMKQAGLNISPRDIIAFPTIAELAQNIGEDLVINAKQGKVSGNVPLTPSKHYFFEKEYYNVNQFNEAWLYEIQINVDANIAKKTLNLLAEHHDAIRIRFEKNETGWNQYLSEQNETIHFEYHDFSEFDYDIQKSKIESLCNYYQTRLDIIEGPLFRVIFFYLGEQSKGRMLIVSHRLLTDSTSIKILAEDFQHVYYQLLNGETPDLPSKTTSYQYWSEKLFEFANSKEINQELSYWSNDHFYKSFNLPVDFSDGDNTEKSTEWVFKSLNQEETKDLLQLISELSETNMNHVLFTVLLKTMYEWTGSKSLIVESGGHGRELISDEIDLSRTVGWFNTNFPVYLELQMDNDIQSILVTVKEQLSSIPNNGIGYGLLRYLNKNEGTRVKLADMPIPAIGFDYQGHKGNFEFNKIEKMFMPAKESVENYRNPKNSRIQEFDISSWISNQQYTIRWAYSNKRYKKSTIEYLVNSYINNLKEVITINKTKVI
ncbi:condensation domain-containing protein [Bacillus cereus]|uniref:condensation domain-containing protein n=1 Tax=Bacillus cereus TaxID=1396 RepID=UPI001374D61A|nr:condensation domain-containing protein [Bacillus cereus]